MSIFKETFKDFVFKQLRIREAIIEQGNNPSKFQHRFGNPRNKIQLKGKENIANVDIAAGAFYTNTVHKQCVLRMSSGVDILSNEFLETSEKEKMLDENLARAYILEGGILDEKEKQRSGFARNKGTYGDSSLRSNAADGFGIVPMPGIIDADIRTKTAYGSLREAKVNFVCHNRRQLEILELLYMRPGFPILLEWQWSPFINNKGKIDNNPYGIGKDWFDKTKTINELNTSIVETKIKSGGNYDGFVGFCKNFEFTSRPDGGYDCTTEIIAAGEILEGLKARMDGFSKKEEEKIIQIDNMQFILEAIKQLSRIKSKENVKGNIASSTLLARSPLVQEFIKKSEGIDIYAKAGAGPLGKGAAAEKKLRIALKELRDYYQDMDKYFIFLNDKQGSIKDYLFYVDATRIFKRTYVRWDHLCDLINKIVFPLPNPDKPDDPLVELTYTQVDNDGKNQILEFIPYKFPTEAYSSVNNTNGVIKRMNSNYKSLMTKIMVEDVLDNSFDPTICLLPTQYPATDGLKRKRAEQFNAPIPMTEEELTKEKLDIAEQQNHHTSISHIMLNVDHLLKVYNQMAYSNNEPNENFNLFDYIKQIWQDVNKACVGNHNFILQTELERPNKIRIIDLQVDPPNNIKTEDLFEFKIQSNKSIVRDFNYNTTIPGALSATIAIAAQAPTSVSDLDQVTFANFSKGIKSRFTTSTELKKNSPPVVDPEKLQEIKDRDAEIKNNFDKDVQRYKENVIDLALYQAKLISGDVDFQPVGGTDEIDDRTFGEALALANSLQQQVISLLQKDPNTGKRNPIIPSRKSAVIPLKFNCKMDGVSGIVIGHVFKVEKDKLPKGYQSDDVAFVVMGESQKISSGQDWTTEISGQLILLDLGKEDTENLNSIFGDETGLGGLGKIASSVANTSTEPIETNDIIDNGPQVDDVILPVNKNINPYDPSDVYNWEEWEKNNNPSAQFNNCPPGQVFNEDLQACVLEDISIEPKVGNTGLTQEQIDNGGLETTKRRVNGKTPYEYAYLLQAAGSAQNGALQEEFFKGNSSNVNILISKCDKLRQQYSSVFQYNFNIQDFPSLRNANVGSAFSSYESWITYLSKTFPNLV